jgi:NAD(P)H dehydrogenase (quinone)
MNILYVYAHHDDPNSVNAALRDEAQRMLRGMGHAVIESDLYGMGFKPVLDERDFSDRALLDRFVPNVEIRHALLRGTVPPEIASELERVKAADLVIFQFPLWWASVPAILKGWFDRVLSFAFAADAESSTTRPFVRGKKAMLFTTLEAPEAVYATGNQGGIREVLAPISFNTLGYAGMTVLPTFIVYEATPDRPRDWIAAQLERLKSHIVLVMTGL